MQPLILTLVLDNESQEYFNQLRKKHFPPEKNFLDAHLTLFHNLPADEEQIRKLLQEVSTNHSTIQLNATEVRSIGAGVAYKVESDELIKLHQYLQKQWRDWLIPQDQHKLWPHVTVQNKVEHATAVELQQQLAQNFKPFAIQGVGLALWEYLNGPWRLVKTYNFKQ